MYQNVSLFRYAGSKARIIKRILYLMPDHVRYVSLFGGSAGDLIHKPRSKVEVYNDLNEDVVNVFRVLRSVKGRKTLRQQLYLTPYSRLQFAECLAVLHSDERDPVRRAWAFLFCTLSGTAGADPGIYTKGSFGVPKLDGLRPNWNDLGRRIESVGRRLQHVIIENRPWQEIVKQYCSADTLFYCDPPYVLSTRQGRYYAYEMTDQQHIELLDVLRKVDGYVMLSGYGSELYEQRLADWRRVEFTKPCSLSPAPKKPMRQEVVWMNFNKDGEKLQG